MPGLHVKLWLPRMAIIAGEITTTAWVDMPDVVRQTIREIGYNSSDMGFDWQSCAVLTSIDKQSADIAQGVDEGKGLDLDQGAGDQGLMFGYACNETDVLMPMPIYYAHLLTKQQAEIRKAGKLPWLRPDAKSQVTIEYADGRPRRIEAVVLSTQHDDTISYSDLKEAVMEMIIKPVLPQNMLTPTPNSILIRPVASSLVGLSAIAELPAGKSSSTPMAVKAPTAVAPSQGRIHRKSIAHHRTWGDTSLKISSLPGLPPRSRCRLPMPSAYQNRFQSMSTASEPVKFLTTPFES